MATSAQKFIQRNRAPRVQIEYDVELYGAEKKVQLPFVMGVMSDLSGNPKEPLPPVADRKFLEISVDNFDDRLKAMKPRVAFQVPNTLTGEGNLSVDLTFESMDDFSPAAIARKVGALNQAAAGAQPAREPGDLHGRQDRRRGADRQAAQGSGAAAGARRRAQARRRRRRPATSSSEEEPWLRHRKTQRPPPQTDGGERVRLAAATRSSSRRPTGREDGGRDRRPRPWPSRRWPSSKLISSDVVQTINAMIAEIDKKLSEQINEIMHHGRLPAARERLARAALPRQQHRDRRDAQDPGHEHLEEGSAQDPQALQGRRLGSEPDLQEALRGGVRPARAASPTAAWSATTTSTTAPDVELLGEMAKIAAAAHAPFIAAAVARRSSRWSPGRSWPTRAI